MDAESLKVDGEIYILTGENALKDFMSGVEVYSRTGEGVKIEVAGIGKEDAAKTTAAVTTDTNGIHTITITLAQAADSHGAQAFTATHRDVLKALQSVGGEAGVFF